eukprot:3319197-Alexandrium_andersonii.AAC.1
MAHECVECARVFNSLTGKRNPARARSQHACAVVLPCMWAPFRSILAEAPLEEPMGFPSWLGAT